MALCCVSFAYLTGVPIGGALIHGDDYLPVSLMGATALIVGMGLVALSRWRHSRYVKSQWI